MRSPWWPLVVETHLKSLRLLKKSVLKGNALILFENRQIVTRSTLILSEIPSDAVSCVSLAIFNAHSAAANFPASWEPHTLKRIGGGLLLFYVIPHFD